MLKIKCQCCGFEREFRDSQEAFEASWDDPGHFTIITCDLCPASYVALGIDHSEIHRQWECNGRPEKFGSNCVNPDPVSQAFFKGQN